MKHLKKTILFLSFLIAVTIVFVHLPASARDVTDLGKADDACWDKFSACADAFIEAHGGGFIGPANPSIKHYCWPKLVDCRIKAKDDFYKCIFSK